MEQELNIAAILKDKPVGTKLYSPCCGVCTKGNDGNSERPITLCLPNRVLYRLLGNGKEFETGEIMVYPSKEMQDWSKFAWKKGDVLKNKNGITCIFDSFRDEDYLSFCTWYYYDPGDQCWEYNVTNISTLCFKKVDESDRASYIKKVEEHYGGKLNLETLEIEKSEPQFKVGDIVVFKMIVFIFGGIDDNGNIVSYQSFNARSGYLCQEEKFGHILSSFENDLGKMRLATDSEKQQLFDALAKEGKRWNSETKTLEDLPKKCELKAFDKVLVRDDLDNHWRPYFFYKVDSDKDYPYIMVNGEVFSECIPYNEHTAHLLGTTDDWKGGKE